MIELHPDNLLPTPEQIARNADRPSRATAIERSIAAGDVIRELRDQGLSYGQIIRLCDLPSTYHTIKGLEAGRVKQLRQPTADKIMDGYDRYLEGDRAYLKPWSYRPPAERVPPAPKPKTAKQPKPVAVKKHKPQPWSIKPKQAKPKTLPPTPIVPVAVESILAPRPSLRERLAAKRRAGA